MHADGKTVIQKTGDFPVGSTYVLPEEGCALDRGHLFVLRCLAQDGDSKGLFVAGFKTDALAQAQRDNQLVGLYSGIFAVVLGILLAFLFSSALAAPVAQVTQAARVVASGDVTRGEGRDLGRRRDHVDGELVQRDARARSGSWSTEMVSLTERLAGASQGLISASADQTQVTGQQSAYAQQIAATFEELSAHRRADLRARPRWSRARRGAPTRRSSSRAR